MSHTQNTAYTLFQEEIERHAAAKDWYASIDRITDRLVMYMVYDGDFIGNAIDAEDVYHLLTLKTFFKQLSDLEK